MLIEATFENILSFDKPTTFSMVAGKITKQHKDHVRKVGGIPVLRGAILYGANAAGKSNFVKALDLLISMLQLGDCVLSVGKHFQLATTSSKELRFDIRFSWRGRIFGYHLKTDGIRVLEESLLINANGADSVLFERKNNDVTLGRDLDHDWYRWRTLKGQALYLSKLVSDGLEENGPMIPNSDLVMDAVSGMQAMQTFTLKGIRPGNIPMIALGTPTLFKEFLKKLLIKADAGISDVIGIPLSKKAISEIPLDELFAAAGADIVQKKFSDQSFSFFHNGKYLLVRHGNNGYSGEEIRLRHGTAAFPLSAESDGTVRLLEFAPFLRFASQFPATYVVDEFDRHLHPVLAKFLLTTLFETSHPDAQFITTAHDTSLMTHDLWRTDEVWFAEKRLDGSTDLYSMYNFTPRFDKNLEKGYRQGLYGAVPFPGGGMRQ